MAVGAIAGWCQSAIDVLAPGTGPQMAVLQEAAEVKAAAVGGCQRRVRRGRRRRCVRCVVAAAPSRGGRCGVPAAPPRGHLQLGGAGAAGRGHSRL